MPSLWALYGSASLAVTSLQRLATGQFRYADTPADGHHRDDTPVETTPPRQAPLPLRHVRHAAYG